MPIRGLEGFLINNYTNKLPLKVIEDTIVAIDGFWFLKKYVPLAGKGSPTEHMAAITAGLSPLIEMTAVTQFLWIWDGIDYMNSIYYKKKQEVPGEKGKVEPEWFVDIVNEILSKAGIVVMRAPYSAMAQCLYFFNAKYVRYVFTKTDALYFRNGTKIIVNFDFTHKTLDIIDRSEIFRNLGFNLYGFQVFSFMCGCEACYTVPMHAKKFKIENVWELMNSVERIEEVLQNYVEAMKFGTVFEKTEEYAWLKLFRNSFISVEYHPVMGISGRIEFLNNEYVPSNLSELFGNSLNLSIYQEIFCGNLSPLLFNKIAWGTSSQDKIMTKNLRVLHKLFDKTLQFDKPIKISEVLVRLFDMNVFFVDEIERLSQILFLLLQDANISCTELLPILSSMNTGENDNILLKRIQLFGREYNYFIAIRDIAKLIKLIFPKTTLDLNFNIAISDNLSSLKISYLTLFLKKNISKDAVEKYLKLLI